MRSRVLYPLSTYVVVLLGLCGASVQGAQAQRYPERREIRQGNRLFEKGEFAESETSYLRALEQAPESAEATFNLADALYKQERYEESAALSAKVAQDTLASEHAPAALYNAGNGLLQQRKLQEAIEAYKASLRLNPSDQEAKFNLAYAQKLLDNQQNQDQNQDQNKDQDQQNQDQQQDQNKDQQDQDKGDQDQQKDQNKDQQDQDKEKGDQNQDQQNQDQNRDQQGEGDQDKEQQEQPQQGNAPQPQMSKEQAEQMLNAMQGAEQKTKERVDAQRVKGVARSGKNW